MSQYEIYTDGSMRSDGVNFHSGAGGWAFVVLRDGELYKEALGSDKDTTNQKMELTAAIQALERTVYKLKPNESITLYSDSAYLINCYKQKWYYRWQENNWRNSKKEPVANRDLWERLIPFFNNPACHFEKVKGHADNKYNNLCDQLAQTAAETTEGINEKNYID